MQPLSAHRDGGQAMLALFRAATRDNRGATAIEYGLIVSLIFIAIIIAVSNAAGATVSMWNNVAFRVINT